MLNTVSGINEPSRLADTIVAHLNLKLDERQQLLELTDAPASGSKRSSA